MTYLADYKTSTEMYDHKYNEIYNKLMKKRAAGEKKCEEEMQIGRKAEADTIAKFKLLYGDIDLDNEDDGIVDISGANIVTSTPDESVKGTNKDSPTSNLSSSQAVSGGNGNTTKLENCHSKLMLLMSPIKMLANLMILRYCTTPLSMALSCDLQVLTINLLT